MQGTAENVLAQPGVAFSNVEVATFVEPDLRDGPSEFTATIFWGDGSSSSGTLMESSGVFHVLGSHSYATSGSFPIEIDVSQSWSLYFPGLQLIGLASVPNQAADETQVLTVKLQAHDKLPSRWSLTFKMGAANLGTPKAAITQKLEKVASKTKFYSSVDLFAQALKISKVGEIAANVTESDIIVVTSISTELVGTDECVGKVKFDMITLKKEKVKVTGVDAGVGVVKLDYGEGLLQSGVIELRLKKGNLYKTSIEWSELSGGTDKFIDGKTTPATDGFLRKNPDEKITRFHPRWDAKWEKE